MINMMMMIASGAESMKKNCWVLGDNIILMFTIVIIFIIGDPFLYQL